MARKIDHKTSGALTIAAEATVAITGNPTAGTLGGGLFAKLDTDTAKFVLAGVGDEPIGICESNVLAGAEADLLMSEIPLIKLGYAASALDYVEVGASGVAVKATGLRPIGGQLTTGGASGDMAGIIFGKKPDYPITGADVASAATIVPTGERFTLTGTDTVTAITMIGAKAGKRLLIKFASTATVTLAHMVGGTLGGSADDLLELDWDGTVLREIGRSVNA
jgi:hypothetical protein